MGGQLATDSSFRSGARFAWFQIDLSSGELLRSGARVPIQDQPFQVLRLLLEAEGKVVTREQLRAPSGQKTHSSISSMVLTPRLRKCDKRSKIPWTDPSSLRHFPSTAIASSCP